MFIFRGATITNFFQGGRPFVRQAITNVRMRPKNTFSTSGPIMVQAGTCIGMHFQGGRDKKASHITFKGVLYKSFPPV